MPDFTILKFKNFKGGLHLARGITNAYDKSLDTLHSDTLKSAIFSTALSVFGEDAIDRSFFDQFLISSAFPFFASGQQQEEQLYFFPKPELIKLPLAVDGNLANKEKTLKKVRYIEKSLFEALLQGENAGTLTEENFVGPFVSHPNKPLRSILARENCTAILQSEPYQHVNIARDQGSDSTPYFVDKIYFHPKAGLYIILQTSNDTVKGQVIAALRLMAESGIGTNRNTGYGHFELEVEEMSLTLPEKGTHQLNLSLYWPEKTEIESHLQESYYGLTKRGGYISSPANDQHLTLRKRSVYMFTEGSIFPFLPGRKGKIADLRPDFDLLKHPIWRDGQPIFVPINLSTHES